MRDPRAKPTLFVPLVGLPMLFILGGGALAFGLHTSREAEHTRVVPAFALADPARVPHGSYVETEGVLVHGDRGGVHLEDVPDVAVRIERTFPSRPPVGTRIHLMGRVCDAPRRSACGLQYSDGDTFPEARVISVGMSPEHSRTLAAKLYAVAAGTVVVYLGVVAFSRRRRRGGTRVAEERAWTLPYEAEEIASRVRKLEREDRFLVVDEGPGRLVFVQGYSENAARGWGIRKPDVFPRRATLTWQSSVREPTRVSVRVEEDLRWWPAGLTPTMDRLARESIASTLAGIQRVLGVSQEPAR